MDEFEDLERELFGTESSSATIDEKSAHAAMEAYLNQGWWEKGKLIRASPLSAKFRWMGFFSLLAIIVVFFASQFISDAESRWDFVFCFGIIPFILLQMSLPLGFGIMGGGSDGGDGGSGGG